uniref:triacylglycerol lipase n=1 Tax=Lygus hesperus TaxID=30085 RepID=A0A0A9W8S5_LYGHE
MNLSFAGCGFLGIYHVGVAVCLKKYAPHLLLNHISGASAGAIAACGLLCDIPIGDVVSDVLNLIREARLRTLGPFSPSFHVQEVLLEGLSKVLPEDAHLRVNGKLHISLTRVYDGKNVIVSHFDSKEDLLECLLASCFVPIFSGFIPPKFHGERYIDGGFSNNLPLLDEHTITVSPFCGESDICPRDESSQLFHMNVANTSIALSKQNIYRFARILWPPKPEILSNMCKQGFDDTLRFLQRNDLINCTRCLAVQSTYVISENVDESGDTCEFDPQCQQCNEHRQEAMVANLPDIVVGVFQDYIDSANKGLYNWLLSHRGMQLVTLLSLPYTVPADFALAFIYKLRKMMPYMTINLRSMCKFMICQMIGVLETVSTKAGYKLTATLQMEYDLGTENDHVFDKEINLNFKIEDSNLELDQLTTKALSRRGSFTPSETMADDTFENILQVTAHHDAIMAYYYMDENNKVRVTEIFDVTDMPVDSITDEYHTWKENSVSSWVKKQADGNITNFVGDFEEDESEISSTTSSTENQHFFSDPESEWVLRSEFVPVTSQSNSLRPESDQETSNRSDESC